MRSKEHSWQIRVKDVEMFKIVLGYKTASYLIENYLVNQLKMER